MVNTCNVLVSPPGLSICVPASKKPQITWCKVAPHVNLVIITNLITSQESNLLHWASITIATHAITVLVLVKSLPIHYVVAKLLIVCAIKYLTHLVTVVPIHIN